MDKTTRKYKKWSDIPSIPIRDYLPPLATPSNSSSSNSSANASQYGLITPPTTPLEPSFLTTSASVSMSTISSGAGTGLHSPFSHVPFSHSQPRLHAESQDEYETMDGILSDVQNKYDSLGHFIYKLFENIAKGCADPRSSRHRDMVLRFLQGRTHYKPVQIVDRIYNHRYSSPTYHSEYHDERNDSFSPTLDAFKIQYARPAISTWATKLVGDCVHRQTGKLAQNNQNDSTSSTLRSHLPVSANGRRAEKTQTVTWEDIEKLKISSISAELQRRAPLAWYLTECMAAPRRNGLVITRKRRPHPQILTAAITSFILSRNRLANGYLALPLGIWLFSCQSHVDTKRIMCRMGLSISDSAIRDALDSMTRAGLQKLKTSVVEHAAKGEVGWCLILDNVQQYCRVFEHGIGRQNQLKVGTAATAVRMEDCPPGAFNAKDHHSRVAKMERADMTTESLFSDIDWSHNEEVMALHFVRVLANFIPELDHLQKAISDRFRSPPIAIHRMREGRKTEMQALGTNAEREVETQGMLRCLNDFDSQMGVLAGTSDELLSWGRGDGASFAAMLRVQKYLAAIDVGNPIETCQNRISTPEIWHARSTCLSTIASNHFGESASTDPSSLSKSTNAANMKRPSDLKSCDFYPTSRAMNLCWEAQVLDCWRETFGIETDLVSHFVELAQRGQLPNIDSLLQDARTMYHRYASLDAYEQALSLKLSTASDLQSSMRVPSGTPWVPPSDSTSKEPRPQGHRETEEFDGDRVLANSILFLREYGWWVEMSYAIPEGDIGRAYEILKIWIFVFGGSSNQNYVGYLLETYCLLKYEASESLKTAILNNWLVNTSGEPGKWIEGDLSQEHANFILEDMVEKYAGEWDGNFYRQTIAPNIHHFVRIRGEFQAAFDLRPRGKVHKSAHLQDEYTVLTTFYHEQQLHRFRSKRSMGHAAINLVDRGYKRLQNGKLKDFIKKSTAHAAIVSEINRAKDKDSTTSTPPSGEHTGQVQAAMNVDGRVGDDDDGDDESGKESDEDEEKDGEEVEDDKEEEEEDYSEVQVTSGYERGVYVDEGGRMVDDWEEPDENLWDDPEDESDDDED